MATRHSSLANSAIPMSMLLVSSGILSTTIVSTSSQRVYALSSPLLHRSLLIQFGLHRLVSDASMDVQLLTSQWQPALTRDAKSGSHLGDVVFRCIADLASNTILAMRLTGPRTRT